MPTTGKRLQASLYFHVPFCTKKCPYCHFFVVPNKEEYQIMYLAALKKEWLRVHPLLSPYDIISIYFGGGTPSLLGAQRIHEILSWIYKDLSVDSQCEITLEANPENVTLDKMKAFAKAGVNRVSLGLQSLDEHLLQILGRSHTASKSVQAVMDTYDAGIGNISVDLMFELPHQNMNHWKTTLSKVTSLPITHLSLYNLTFERGTIFGKKEKELAPHVVDPSIGREMFEEAEAKLKEAGLLRYEISAFATAGYESVHNTGYWTARPFLGLGPSAFSFWEGKRFQNVCNLHQYCQYLQQDLSPVTFKEKLPYPENIQELLAVEIRLVRGVHLEEFEARHGTLTHKIKASLHLLETKGWIQREGSTVKLSQEGLFFYDSIAEELI